MPLKQIQPQLIMLMIHLETHHWLVTMKFDNWLEHWKTVWFCLSAVHIIRAWWLPDTQPHILETNFCNPCATGDHSRLVISTSPIDDIARIIPNCFVCHFHLEDIVGPKIRDFLLNDQLIVNFMYQKSWLLNI